MHVNLTKASGFALLASLLCISAGAQQQSSQQSGSGDPVADAARKTQQQKKDAPKPKRVYTDDDISTKKSDISVVGTPPDATGATTQQQNTADQAKAADTSAAGQATPVGDKDKEDPNSESAWRKRFGKLREKIATAEQELDILQREENKGSVQYYSDPTKAMNEQYSRDEINKKNAKIEAKKKQVAALKQQWDDLEDQLRKAHGDPGWAR